MCKIKIIRIIRTNLADIEKSIGDNIRLGVNKLFRLPSQISSSLKSNEVGDVFRCEFFSLNHGSQVFRFRG